MEKKEKNSLVETFNSIPVGIYQTRLSDGLVLNINEYGAKLLGFESADEIIGKVSVSDLYAQDTRERLIGMLQDHNEVTDFEICFQLGNNDKEIWVCATAKLSKDKETIEGSLTDITKRKVEMQEIHKQNAKILIDVQSKIDAKLQEYNQRKARA